MRYLLRNHAEPGVYFIFARYMELPPIPLYVGKASDIKTRLSGEHGFAKHFLDSPHLELSLSLTVVYTKDDIGLTLYLEGLFLQLFDFAFNQKDNDSYRIEEMQKRMIHERFCELPMMAKWIEEPETLNVTSEEVQSKLNEVRKTLDYFFI